VDGNYSRFPPVTQMSRFPEVTATQPTEITPKM
jgi:hypothetical protein